MSANVANRTQVWRVRLSVFFWGTVVGLFLFERTGRKWSSLWNRSEKWSPIVSKLWAFILWIYWVVFEQVNCPQVGLPKEGTFSWVIDHDANSPLIIEKIQYLLLLLSFLSSCQRVPTFLCRIVSEIGKRTWYPRCIGKKAYGTTASSQVDIFITGSWLARLYWSRHKALPAAVHSAFPGRHSELIVSLLHITQAFNGDKR